MDAQYTRGQSQDLRDVTARIRAIELFNPDGLLPPVPFVSHPRFPLPALSPFVLRRSPFTSSPSNSPSGLLPLFLVPSASIPLFFPVAAYFFCLATRAQGDPLYLFHPPPLRPPACLPSPFSLLSRRPCSRAVPLYLPPPSPVVPSSLKAVESNR